MRVFLIRHPPPLIEPGVCYGRLDVDCHAPEPFAALLRARLPAGIAIHSSPLRRALRLARALSPTARVDARLSEIDFGAWEGRRWDEIGEREIGAWAADVLNFAPPGGESVAALRARALDFAASLEDDAALVTHAGVMRVLAGHWRHLPTADWLRLEFGFGEMVRFDLAPPPPKAPAEETSIR
ncbi:MAG: histidine phosphatase family protein [Candidatus Accumulibacter sp.]|nr:histidine phosphatase family protein [Accumulibacter sp.]